MARTTYDLDEELVEKAREMAGLPTKKAAIEEALREFVNAGGRRIDRALGGGIST
jgi:Arc/MetJ family transcription regulator